MLIEPAKATGSMISPLFGCMYVWMYVRNELISETAPTIFLKLGMKLGDNKGKKIARLIFAKNSDFGRFWPNMPKNSHFGPKSQFLGICEETAPPNFLKLH